MRFALSIILTLSMLFTYSQDVDTIINRGVYKSYYSIHYKEPLYVGYTLWHGGGGCDRSHFYFKNDTKVVTATLGDYAGSGYDQGHLANANDFANDCVKDELTFRFYNCLPQTPNLNRGVWKHWETDLRKESQTDSLYIYCGGIFSESSKKIGNGVYVPDKCWKIVISLKQHKVLHVLLFTNTTTAEVKEIQLEELRKIVGYRIPKITW